PSDPSRRPWWGLRLRDAPEESARSVVLAMGGLRAGLRGFGSIIMSCGEILFWAVYGLVYAVASGGISC
ncbi:MAG: hypothetical protein ACPIOQ_74340, partial [Promethearchaeia archaeon]